MVFCRVNQVDAILKSVARTFYLSLTYLPKAIRQPMSLAYLLARLADTIVDTQTIPLTIRKEALLSLRYIVQNLDDKSLENLTLPISQCAPYLSGSNLILLNNSELLLALLKQQSASILTLIQEVLGVIFTGQAIDLDYFDSHAPIVHFNTEQDLDHYLYCVAGVVGEFWTKLCFLCIPNYATVTPKQLQPQAIAFGKALQLTNILKDLQADLKIGRCYLPLQQTFTEEERKNPQLFMQKLQENNPNLIPDWRSQALLYLEQAQDYTQTILNRRVRFATLVPYDLAHKTLAILPMKVSRNAVYATILKVLFQSYIFHPRGVSI